MYLRGFFHFFPIFCRINLILPTTPFSMPGMEVPSPCGSYDECTKIEAGMSNLSFSNTPTPRKQEIDNLFVMY